MYVYSSSRSGTDAPPMSECTELFTPLSVSSHTLVPTSATIPFFYVYFPPPPPNEYTNYNVIK